MNSRRPLWILPSAILNSCKAEVDPRRSLGFSRASFWIHARPKWTQGAHLNSCDPPRGARRLFVYISSPHSGTTGTTMLFGVTGLLNSTSKRHPDGLQVRRKNFCKSSRKFASLLSAQANGVVSPNREITDSNAWGDSLLTVSRPPSWRCRFWPDNWGK